MKLLGTNARRIHFATRSGLGAGSATDSTVPGFGFAGPAFTPPGGTPIGFAADRPHTTISAARTANPMANSHAWLKMLIAGSMNSG